MIENPYISDTLKYIFTALLSQISLKNRKKAVEMINLFRPPEGKTATKIDGRSISWTDKRRASASEKWEKKRRKEVFYIYQIINEKIVEKKVFGIDECCKIVSLQKSYVRNRINRENGEVTFGRGISKILITKTKLTENINERYSLVCRLIYRKSYEISPHEKFTRSY